MPAGFRFLFLTHSRPFSLFLCHSRESTGGYLSFGFLFSTAENLPYLAFCSKKRHKKTFRISPAIETWGQSLESPGNFSGPKSNIQIEIYRIRAWFLASKLLHFDSLTDSSKQLKRRPLNCEQSLMFLCKVTARET